MAKSIDSLYLYLREVEEMPSPLSSEEEIILGKRIQKGDWQARNMLVETNLRFGISIAKEYEGRGLPLAELIALANIGLMKAAERFDPGRGTKFITYAIWWIRQVILHALATTTRTVELPSNKVEQIKWARRLTTALEQQLGRKPEPEELAKNLAKELKTSEEKVIAIMALDYGTLSLDWENEKDHGTTFGNLFRAETESPDAESEKNSTAEKIRKCLNQLPPREAKILCSLYGLDGKEPKSGAEIGRDIGVTKERIRQIKNRAQKSLRKKLAKLNLT